MRYQVSVWRKIQVFVEIEAIDEKEVIDKYEAGDFSSEEEVVDSSDIEKLCISQNSE